MREVLRAFLRGIERRNGEHVHLIDDIYAVFRRSRREVGFFNERADAVYAVVTRGVQLYNVQNRAVIQSSAHVALAA